MNLRAQNILIEDADGLETSKAAQALLKLAFVAENEGFFDQLFLKREFVPLTIQTDDSDMPEWMHLLLDPRSCCIEILIAVCWRMKIC